MGFLDLNMSLFVTLVTFLLAQKGAKTRVFEPALGVMAKRALCPMLLPARLAHPSLGKEASAFLQASAAHCALVTDSQHLKLA